MCSSRRGSASTRRRTSTGCPTSPRTEHWTTLHDHVSFQVEFADTRAARRRRSFRAALDHEAWDHLFRASTSSGPGRSRTSASSRSTLSVRFITACANCTSTSGAASRRSHPSARARAVSHHGGPGDRCADVKEREPPPRGPVDIPVPDPKPGPVRAHACAGGLPHLAAACAARASATAAAPLQGHAGARSRLLRGSGATAAESGSSPIQGRRRTRPGRKGPVDRPFAIPVRSHRSGRRLATPRTLEQKMAAEQGDRRLAGRLAIRSPSPRRYLRLRAREAVLRAAGERTRPAGTPPPQKPRLDFHQALPVPAADYPELMPELGARRAARFDRPAADPGTIRVIAKWDRRTRRATSRLGRTASSKAASSARL